MLNAGVVVLNNFDQVSSTAISKDNIVQMAEAFSDSEIEKLNQEHSTLEMKE